MNKGLALLALGLILAAPAWAASQVSIAPRAFTHINPVFRSVTVPSPLSW